MARMNTPHQCKIEVFSSLHPSEDPKKVELAISNIFPICKIEIDKFSVKGISSEPNSLEKIQDTINSMQTQAIFRKTLQKNLENNTTWFYLNKQAAFVEKLAICEESEESPLGPIKVVITAPNIDKIIDWLISSPQN